MKKSILKISILILFFAPNNLMSNTEFFEEGLTLFKNKKFNEAKFKFEQYIVFNPKSEMSYLYLSKIFKSFEKKNLEEQNLNTVILINQKNEEAIKRTIAKTKFLDIYLSTNVISEEVSRRLPPFFWTSS